MFIQFGDRCQSLDRFQAFEARQLSRKWIQILFGSGRPYPGSQFLYRRDRDSAQFATV
jgi:hypothetical protein